MLNALERDLLKARIGEELKREGHFQIVRLWNYTPVIVRTGLLDKKPFEWISVTLERLGERTSDHQSSFDDVLRRIMPPHLSVIVGCVGRRERLMTVRIRIQSDFIHKALDPNCTGVQLSSTQRKKKKLTKEQIMCAISERVIEREEL